jgi:hypothetical protein
MMRIHKSLSGCAQPNHPRHLTSTPNTLNYVTHLDLSENSYRLIGQVTNLSVVTIRVKRPPKPESVKRRLPTALPLLFPRIRRASTSISSSHSPSSPTLLMRLTCRLPLTFTMPLCRFVGRSDCAPGPAFLASLRGPLFSPRPRRTSTIGSHRAVERAWAPMTTP